jgi:hypothetical protein
MKEEMQKKPMKSNRIWTKNWINPMGMQRNNKMNSKRIQTSEWTQGRCK